MNRALAAQRRARLANKRGKVDERAVVLGRTATRKGVTREAPKFRIVSWSLTIRRYSEESLVDPDYVYVYDRRLCAEREADGCVGDILTNTWKGSQFVHSARDSPTVGAHDSVC
jgi:hypothetical protein